MYHSSMRACARFVAVVLLVSPSIVFANHGPGTSGGGSATASGETLKPGSFDLSIREDYTKFENISRAEAERRAILSDEFDALDHSSVTTVGITYGLFENFQISAQIGYYFGSNFIDAEADGAGGAESATTDPRGLTDLGLQAKYRFISGEPGNIAIIGGIIIPTGKDDEKLDNGELLEPSSQPGTGAFAYQASLAYSRFLTSHITIDASAIYTLRTEHDGFKVGDRADLGVAVAYRLTDSIKSFPNYSVFGEATAVWLDKDEEEGEENPNSGGWTVYLTPGLRVRFNEHIAMTVAPSFPIVQDLNGDQIESQFKLALALNFSF